jgi:hypothetical protein
MSRSKKPVEVLAPLQEREAYWAYCGDVYDKRSGKYVAGFEKFGCGWRLLYVMKVGRKWVKLMDPTTLESATILKRDWPSMKAGTADTAWCEKIIIRQLGIRERTGNYISAPVVRFCEALREEHPYVEPHMSLA